MPRVRRRVLVLFSKEWDSSALRRAAADDIELVYAGFDLFRFPSNVRLATFDACRFVEQLAQRWRGRIDGVISNNEYFGATIAAVLAAMLGLPGSPPRALIAAQHKYYSRLAQKRAAPEAVPTFAVFPFGTFDVERLGLAFPFYVKPVRATFSVLTRLVRDPPELQRHLHFGRAEEWIIRRLVKPYNDLAARFAPEQEIDAHHLIVESPARGIEVNLDGWLHEGRLNVLGASDALMYPGTDQFHRFVHPSQLPARVMERLTNIAERVFAALGYDHGFFNLEAFWDPDADQLTLIEINPRMASQLAGLYARVGGFDPYRALLDLACGDVPRLVPIPGAARCAVAASCIGRRFDGAPMPHRPTARELAEVRGRYPDAEVMLYLKRGAALRREMKWLGSHRYLVVNVGGESLAEIEAAYAEIHRLLGFDPAGTGSYGVESPYVAEGI
jgi:hypothetical protein